MTFCHALELKSPKDGKMYKTGVADMQGVFRIIQSVPSPKAEPFKMWLAEFGKERKENLRDNMSTTELILNMLAETAAKDIAESTNPQGLEENKKVVKRGDNIAGNARKEIEVETGKPVITSKNAIDFGKLIDDVTKTIGKGDTNDDK